ncbi:MAG: YfdQ family protein [Zoogloeaceae bacterium]|jgi:uncharacterized protein YfdQ (DUF2303 family)|nr:YfdQ family protein [Zoogloeaceae bacterium]
MEENLSTIVKMSTSMVGAQTTHGSVPYVIVPEGYQLQSLENLLGNPERKRANVTVDDTDSLIRYSMKHGIPDKSVFYVSVDYVRSACHIVAVINDHGANDPQWRDHLCCLGMRNAVEWDRWLADNKKVKSQNDFAVFLEDNLGDIASVTSMPTGSEMLRMALEFEAHSEKKFRSKTNLQSGGFSIEFVDEENSDTRATMKVFERFTLGIPVFEGSKNRYAVEARLKYRESGGKLSFWYELIRQDKIFKSAVEDEIAAIKEATGFPILYGKP